MRPRLRMPLWAALLVPGAAYVVRSLVIRSGDFTVDVPGDIIVFVTLFAAILAAAWVRRISARSPEDATAPEVSGVSDSDANNQTPDRH